jgi:hypothetical protein
MFSDVKELVTSCAVCQVTGKAPIGKAEIGGSLVGATPFEVVAMDLMSMPVSWMGNKYLMVVQDYLSNYVIVAPIPNKEAETVAAVFLNQVVLVYGPPAVVHSDRGTEFCNTVMTELCRRISSKKTFTTSYHPQADGKVERFNRTIQRLLACYVGPDQKNWDTLLPYVLYAYNTTTSRKHGRSPFNIIFGHDPKNPLLLQLLDGGSSIPMDPSTRWLQHMERHADFVREVVAVLDEEAREASHDYANQSRSTPRLYHPGTLILIKSHMKLPTGAKPKMQKEFRGPYVVLQMTSPVTVSFKPIASAADPDTVHVDNTKPFMTDTGEEVMLSTYMESLGDEGEDAIDEGNQSEEEEVKDKWVVQKVLDYRIANKTIEFQVRWKGFTEEHDEWLREEDMFCHSLVEDFFRTKGAF